MVVLPLIGCYPQAQPIINQEGWEWGSWSIIVTPGSRSAGVRKFFNDQIPHIDIGAPRARGNASLAFQVR